MAALSVGLSGCLSDGGTTEEPSVGTPVNTPPDFDVNPPTDGGDQGSQGEDEPQDPNAPQDPQQPGGDPVVVNPDMDFLINNGASGTRDPNLRLTMFAPRNTFYMKVGYASDCSDGDWDRFYPEYEIPVSSMNTAVTVSVQYRSDEGAVGPCLVRSIRHDTQGPQIVIVRYPESSIEEGVAPEIEYTVSDPSGLSEVGCSLNNISKPCGGGSQVVSISPLPEGSYSFEIVAKDDLGNSSSAVVDWDVVSTTRKLRQIVNVTDYKKVDILINIDNSGSMEYEQSNMAQRVSRFLSILRGLDYQIAVTTTDPRDVTLGDGRLIPIYDANGSFILDTSTPEDIAQYRLGKTLQRPETGGSAEQAIYTSTRVIERSLSGGSAAHRAFLRDDAQLAVLVISDEDESNNADKNDPENLVKLIHDSYGGQKRFTWHSIITRPGDTACRNTNGYSYGERYARFSELTGGVIGSVCEADYAAQVSDIADGIRNLLKTLTLQCRPLSRFPIVVKKDGQVYSGTYVVEGINLKFDSELAPGSYEVEYRCLK